MNLHMIVIAVSCLLITAPLSAEVLEFVEDKDGWMDAVEGAETFNTIDFTDYPKFTFITDQYSDMGIHFTDGDDNIKHDISGFLNDEWGLDGNTSTTIEFDSPQNFFATDHPGELRIQLFSEGDMFYDSIFTFGGGGAGHFSGVLSDQPFDKMHLRTYFGDEGFQVSFDDIYFGAIPAPGALPLLGLALLAHRRRRRR